MQIKFIVRLLNAFIATYLLLNPGNVIAQTPSPSLEQAIRDTGWSVQREADGSLILNPAVSSDNKSTRQTPASDYWLTIQKNLESAGWGVERKADGTLVLVPPSPASSQEVNKEGDPMADMRHQLREAGWTVSTSSDGSLLLYPPEAKETARPQPGTGSIPTIKISLPVDSWKEAYDLSQSWLDRQPAYNASVGKIRKILRIYLVSIVSDKSPHELLQQIAIRSSDGAVIVLN